MKLKFTPSTIGLIDDCERCFWLQYKTGLKRPEGIFPSLPSGMDRILKEHFDSYSKKGQMPPELIDLKDVKLFDDLGLLNKWRSNYQGIVYETEDYILKGAVDAILKKGKKLIVLDYKTRGYPLKEDTHGHYVNQLALYNLLLRKIGYETEDYSYLLFYHPDKVMESVFLFHKDLVKVKLEIKAAELLIDRALKLLEEEMPKADPDCGYCKYRDAKIEVKKQEKPKKGTLLDF